MSGSTWTDQQGSSSLSDYLRLLLTVPVVRVPSWLLQSFPKWHFFSSARPLPPPAAFSPWLRGVLASSALPAPPHLRPVGCNGDSGVSSTARRHRDQQKDCQRREALYNARCAAIHIFPAPTLVAVMQPLSFFFFCNFRPSPEHVFFLCAFSPRPQPHLCRRWCRPALPQSVPRAGGASVWHGAPFQSRGPFQGSER